MDYTVIRTRRRTAAIQVRPDGSVVVRCPLFLSDARIRQLVEGRRDWIQAQQRRLAALPPPPTPAEEQILQRRGEAELPGRVAHWAERMGLFPKNVRITGAKKRLGSCSGKGIPHSGETVRLLDTQKLNVNHRKLFFSEYEVRES